MQQNEISTKDRLLSYVLSPASWIYNCVTAVRNKLYDWGILPSTSFDVPVVSVGNITVGGTGKTPHVEYIVESLSAYYNIAVLSRGYKRKTKGFVLANSHSTPLTIGDEPYQMYCKYGNRAKIAVCENRVKGITELKRIAPDINLVILDDAFQHRRVQPKVNVMLMDYTRPVYQDHVLPLGRLRESKHAVGRADIVVVTKVPEDATPLDFSSIKFHLDLWAYQDLYFSSINYGPLSPVFEEDNKYIVRLDDLDRNDVVMLLTGIANPRPFVRHFKKFDCKVKVNHFPDHHYFTRTDIQKITEKFDAMKGARRLIITTEKDAVRLQNNPYFPQHLKPYIFFLPISVNIVHGLKDLDFIGALRRAIEAHPEHIKGGNE